MKRMNKNDVLVRYAIWEHYNYKNGYNGEPIMGFSDLEIDHIIPISLSKEELEQAKERLELPEDFELDSLENFIPTDRFHNRLKSNTVGDDDFNSMYLGKARKAATKIETRIKVLKKAKENAKLAAIVTDSFNSEEELEEFVFAAMGESRCFAETPLSEIRNGVKYIRAISRVCITGLLPTITKMDVCCKIQFKKLNLMGVNFEFDSQSIIQVLFHSTHSPLIEGGRSFIKSIVDDDVEIQLKDNSFILSKSEAVELCGLIDDFYDHYMSDIKKIDRLLKTSDFQYSGKGYKLLKVNIKTWRSIIEFQNQNDYLEKTDQKWNIFEKNGYFLKVCTHEHHYFNDGYHAIYEPKNVVRDGFLLDEIEDVWITWTPRFLISENDEEYIFKKNEIWDAESAVDFFVNDLIPVVEFRKLKSKKTSLDYDEFTRDFKIEDYCQVNRVKYSSYKIRSNEDALQSIEELQEFFCDNEGLFLTKAEIRDLVRVCYLIIEKTKNPPMTYINGKMNYASSIWSKGNSQEDGSNQMHFSSRFYDNLDLEVLLRSPLCCLRDEKCILDYEEYERIEKALKPLILHFNNTKYLNKYRFSFDY